MTVATPVATPTPGYGNRAGEAPVNRRPLLPTPKGLLERAGATRFGKALIDEHPIASVFAVLAGCYAILVVTLIVLGLAMTHLLGHSRVEHWDDGVNAWFAGHRTPTMNTISADLTLLADTLGIVVGGAIVTIALLARRWRRLALLTAFGLATELAAFLLTNYAVGRRRPGVAHLGSTPSTYSWPSGHTAATLVLYGSIAVSVMMATRRRGPQILAWTVAGALTVGVAISRIYRGEHHPTDVMAGAVLGAGALVAAIVALRTWNLAAPGTSSPSTNGRSEPDADAAPLARGAPLGDDAPLAGDAPLARPAPITARPKELSR